MIKLYFQLKKRLSKNEISEVDYDDMIEIEENTI